MWIIEPPTVAASDKVTLEPYSLSKTGKKREESIKEIAQAAYIKILTCSFFICYAAHFI